MSLRQILRAINHPGWEDNNDGHPKRIQETFDFVVDGIAYKKLDDTTVEVAPWYWKWTHSCNDGHTETVFAGTEYSNRSDGLMIPKEINHENQTYQVGESATTRSTI